MSAWKRCLIGFAPSVWSEPCGTVVLEAMAMGRPVVASRVGGIPDLVVEGETGFLVPAGDAEALAQAATRLLADPSLRARMGAAGRERVTQFQVGTVAARIANMYSQLIA
jgi:glycosyltransferase involved in cell wall biosynthesis